LRLAPRLRHYLERKSGEARLMKAGCCCASGVLLLFTLPASAADPPDISGTYWAKSYNPTIQVLGGGDPPLNAAGKAAYAKIRAGLKDGSIEDKARHVCIPDGVPRVLETPYPFEIFQIPTNQVTFVYEMNHQYRIVAMNEPMPPAKELIVEPRYNGHSVGHWDGDTLVIETAGYNYKSFLDASGLPHSDAMTTVERLRKIGDNLEDTITIHDPEMYTKDWQARFVYAVRNDVRLEDYACNDTHRDLSSVKGVHPR
jgi:hypothetical protein